MGGLKKTETERGGIDRYETPEDLKRVDRRARQSYAALWCLAHLAAIIDAASRCAPSSAPRSSTLWWKNYRQGLCVRRSRPSRQWISREAAATRLFYGGMIDCYTMLVGCLGVDVGLDELGEHKCVDGRSSLSRGSDSTQTCQ